MSTVSRSSSGNSQGAASFVSPTHRLEGDLALHALAVRHTTTPTTTTAYRLARQGRKLAYRFTQTLPTGFGDEARQINKAAASVVRNTAEGANRFKPLEKVQKFEIAQGEAGEAVAAIESLLDIEVGDADIAAEFFAIQGRAAATLTGLIRKHRP